MRLAAAARHFDRQVLADAYGTTVTVRGQFDLFDDSKRDGAVTRRRILSTAPAVSIPARRALQLDGYTWIVGSGNPDYYGAGAIRRKYVLHEADGLANVQTLAEFIAGTAGMSAYTALDWVKAAKEIDESSDLNDVLGAVFAITENVPGVGVLTLAGKHYLLREPHETAAGFLSVLVDEIKAPALEVGTFTDRTYDAVSDTWTGAATEVGFLRLRWQSHFRYLSQRTLHYQPGDDVLICLQSAAAPKANDQITLADGLWQVLTVQAEGDCWSIHVRRIPA